MQLYVPQRLAQRLKGCGSCTHKYHVRNSSLSMRNATTHCTASPLLSYFSIMHRSPLTTRHVRALPPGDTFKIPLPVASKLPGCEASPHLREPCPTRVRALPRILILRNLASSQRVSHCSSLPGVCPSVQFPEQLPSRGPRRSGAAQIPRAVSTRYPRWLTLSHTANPSSHGGGC